MVKRSLEVNKFIGERVIALRHGEPPVYTARIFSIPVIAKILGVSVTTVMKHCVRWSTNDFILPKDRRSKNGPRFSLTKAEHDFVVAKECL